MQEISEFLEKPEIEISLNNTKMHKIEVQKIIKKKKDNTMSRLSSTSYEDGQQ
jgi:hypothetical protein